MEQLVLSSRDLFFPQSKFACCIGVFDGVHVAHKEIFKKTVDEAKKRKIDAICITFSIHPGVTLGKNIDIISPLQDKLRAIEEFGFDKCIILVASPDMMKMSYLEFNYRFLSCAAYIVIGKDFRYGKDRVGNVSTLPKEAEVFEIETVLENDEKISSTIIRQYLENGKIKEANSLLNHPLILSGEVIKGNQLGQTLGFRTANFIYPDGQVKVLFGVYKVKVNIDGKSYNGIASIGIKPTVGSNIVLVETHIFDFDEDIYGKIISVEILDFIREEKKFKNLEELKEQIIKDCKEVKRS